MKIRRITVGGVQRRIANAAYNARRRIGVTLDKDDVRDDAVFAAGFSAWLRRRELRVGSSLTDSILASQHDFGSGTARLAVVVHATEQQALDPVIADLHNIPVTFDLFVSSPSGVDLMVPSASPEHLDTVRFFSMPDQGRDMLPLVALMNSGAFERYNLIAKVVAGGKRSDLFANPDRVKTVLSMFATDPSLGVLVESGGVAEPNDRPLSQPIAASILQRIQLQADTSELRFPADGSMWIRSFVVNGLRSLQLSEWDFESEFGQQDGSTAYALRRLIGIVAREAGYQLRDDIDEHASEQSQSDSQWERFSASATRVPRARVLAMYSTSLGDSSGGSSFRPSGWPDIAASRPSIRGQAQPLLPADLGFYDPLIQSVGDAQAGLAGKYGVQGFLHRIRVDRSGLIEDLPATIEMLRARSGSFALHLDCDVEPLHEQVGDKSGLEECVKHLAILLSDTDYFRVKDVPFLVVSGLNRVNGLSALVESWRNEAIALGLGGIEIVAAADESWSDATHHSILDAGVSAILASPHRRSFYGQLAVDRLELSSHFRGEVRDYAFIADAAERSYFDGAGDSEYPVVLMGYDDTPLRGVSADVMVGSNPFTFRRWLDSAVGLVAARDGEERVVVIDSWNSWLTGAVVEPSDRFGSTFLQAILDVVER